MSNWYAVDDGKTIGHQGSEDGVIVIDEVHEDGARITLEKNTTSAPFGITCGIYGMMMHTTWCSDESKAFTMYESMKEAIQSILLIDPEDEDKIYSEINRFVSKY